MINLVELDEIIEGYVDLLDYLNYMGCLDTQDQEKFEELTKEYASWKRKNF